jgi:hypothetical protein
LARGGDWMRLSASGVVAASSFSGFFPTSFGSLFPRGVFAFAGVVLRFFAEGASCSGSSSSSAPAEAAKKPSAERTCAPSDLRPACGRGAAADGDASRALRLRAAELGSLGSLGSSRVSRRGTPAASRFCFCLSSPRHPPRRVSRRAR